MNTRVLNEGTFRPIRLGDLVVPNYQRDTVRSSHNVETNFNPRLLQAITVVEIRPDELSKLEDAEDRFLLSAVDHDPSCLYLLVDGLQRATGLAHLYPNGEVSLMSQVFRDVSRGEQVALFTALNRGNVRVKDFDIYKANLIGADPVITKLNTAVEGAGYRVRSRGDMSVIGSVGRLAKFCGVNLASPSSDGINDRAVDALRNTLNVLTAVFDKNFPTSEQRTSSGVLFGLAQIFLNGTVGGKPLSVDDVVSRVRVINAKIDSGALSPGQVIANGVTIQAKRGVGSSGGGSSVCLYTQLAWLDLLNKHVRGASRKIVLSKTVDV